MDVERPARGARHPPGSEPGPDDPARSQLVSSFGTNYQVLTAAAFISMALPLCHLRPAALLCARHPRGFSEGVTQWPTLGSKKSPSSSMAASPLSRISTSRFQTRSSLVLVGPSGSGKSTALRLLAGLRGDHLRLDLHRRAYSEQCATQGPRHRHGIPVLCAVPTHVRLRQHGLRSLAPENTERRDPSARGGSRTHPRYRGVSGP